MHQIWQQGDGWRLVADAHGRATVRHPGAVVLIPVQADGQILMIAQYRAALAQTIVELPAGTRGWDEPWAACAQRELREETGFRADRFESLGDIWPAPGISDELMRLYVATDLTPAPLAQDDDEQIEVRPMPLDLLLEQCFDGRLRDAKTIVGLLRFAQRAGRLA